MGWHFLIHIHGSLQYMRRKVAKIPLKNKMHRNGLAQPCNLKHIRALSLIGPQQTRDVNHPSSPSGEGRTLHMGYCKRQKCKLSELKGISRLVSGILRSVESLDRQFLESVKGEGMQAGSRSTQWRAGDGPAPESGATARAQWGQ